MSCYNSTVVPAPAETVWKTIKDFHDLSWAQGVVETCAKVGDKAGDQPGAKRVLNGVFHETLRAINEVDRCFSYSIDDGPGTPVAKDQVVGYLGTVQVFPVTATNESFVLWTSRWDAGNPEIAPFCNGIYQAVLKALTAKHQG